MSLPANPTQSSLISILEALKPSYEGRPKKALYQEIADRLGDIAGQQWKWRYVQSVLSGNGVSPGAEFVRSVEVLSSEMIEGIPALLANAVITEVYAPPGYLHAGAVVLSRSRACANPACTVHFVKNTGNQKYCKPACNKHAWWLRKKMKA